MSRTVRNIDFGKLKSRGKGGVVNLEIPKELEYQFPNIKEPLISENIKEYLNSLKEDELHTNRPRNRGRKG